MIIVVIPIPAVEEEDVVDAVIVIMIMILMEIPDFPVEPPVPPPVPLGGAASCATPRRTPPVLVLPKGRRSTAARGWAWAAPRQHSVLAGAATGVSFSADCDKT